MTKNEDSALCAQNQSGTDDYIDHHNWLSNEVASNMVLAFGSLERFFANLKRFIPYEDVVELRDKFSDMLFQKSVELSQTAKPFTPSDYSNTTRAIRRITLHLRDGQTVRSDFLSPTEEKKFLREHIGLYDSIVSEIYECTGAVKFTGNGAECVPIRTEGLSALQNATVKYMPKVGDIVKIGLYPQETSTPEDLEWVVLDVDTKTNRALLISRNIIDCLPYNKIDMYVTWEDCSLRTWLNDTFLNAAFSEEERERIQTTTIQNPFNPEYYTYGGNPTNDKVFCLSTLEADEYFADDNTRNAKATRNVANRVAEHCGFASWWLRSPGINSNYAAVVGTDGSVGLGGNRVSSARIGVRPALWLQY